ncbi:hypothetical protein GCM10010124_30220 [Pilimelia terevasa]|uniref:Lipoprotein n=1 Tax=Pilimelia terevasa TaxID=53372 RepID=A0A8J3FIX6_9ACTN|nr:lipoprotein [Pilimelia terevasa]GGK35498.1 hypothetical protein GCM10010124_30220 [Pilimelia terevasa]
MAQVRSVAAAAVLATAAAVLAGCTGGERATMSPAASAGAAASATSAAAPSPGRPWFDEVKAAAAGTKVGGAGGGCPMPVAFTGPKGWKVKPFRPGGVLDELAKQGGFTLVCELDAKPAQVLGLMKVMLADQAGGDLRAAVDAYLKPGPDTKVRSRVDREVTVAGVPALEVAYENYSALLETTTRARLLAVGNRGRMSLLWIGGLDEQEHKGLLGGLVLARTTMVVSP